MAAFGTLSNAVRAWRHGFSVPGGAFAPGSELGKRRRESFSNDRVVAARTEPTSRGYGRRRSAGGVPPRYRGSFRRSGYYGRYTVGAQRRRARMGLQIEKKFFDTTISFAVDATGEVPATGQLVLIPQGVTESTRVGRKCQVKSLQVRLRANYVPGADTAGTNTIWIYLVLDKQCNGAAASITDVFTSNNLTLGMINMANSERFRIIRKWCFVMQAGAGVSGAYSQDSKLIEDFIKLNLPMEYSSTTGAITEIKSNNLFFLASTDGAGDDETSVNGTVRIRFTDI